MLKSIGPGFFEKLGGMQTISADLPAGTPVAGTAAMSTAAPAAMGGAPIAESLAGGGKKAPFLDIEKMLKLSGKVPGKPGLFEMLLQGLVAQEYRKQGMEVPEHFINPESVYYLNHPGEVPKGVKSTFEGYKDWQRGQGVPAYEPPEWFTPDPTDTSFQYK